MKNKNILIFFIYLILSQLSIFFIIKKNYTFFIKNFTQNIKASANINHKKTNHKELIEILNIKENEVERLIKKGYFIDRKSDNLYILKEDKDSIFYSIVNTKSLKVTNLNTFLLISLVNI